MHTSVGLLLNMRLPGMRMTRPRRFLVRMSVFLAVVAGVGAVLTPAVLPFFMASPVLNGLIIGVIFAGIIMNLREVTTLGPELEWIERFRRDETAVSSEAVSRGPRLLSPMATMLHEHKGRGRFTLSAPAMRSLLDGIASRMDEARDLSRYFIGLCIFLGLLGTFWGLLQTVGAISDVIGSLEIASQSDTSIVFSALKSGLEQPLQGMGTAFSSSLFGLAGSLILGFMDLQAGQAQNAFYNDLEEWLSQITRLTSGVIGSEGEQSVPAYIQALLEQTAESIDELQRTIARGEEGRTSALTFQRELVERLLTLTDQMRAEQQVLLKMAESQVDMKGLIRSLAETMEKTPGNQDDHGRTYLRNIDITLGRIADEGARGREEAVREIRNEIKLLARTIANLTDEARP
ncbi:flagellar motor protein MotA [Haematospirillum sp. H1815]|uniref:flagellar motor protein MotA n=1 Tax=Haematospirillum sp. H1815 TaxID=2723108 RepID=UPI001FD8102B|nr:flagellar motor protein MotA [Haematospirillum sp. H1815]